MQAEVSAVARRVSEPPFTASSVKARVLEAVHKLGKQATRSMVFLARISTDDTVDTALRGLVRDKYLVEQPGDRYELTDSGCDAIEVEPKQGAVVTHVGRAVASAGPPLKQCRTCRAFKVRDKDFGRANRSPDHRTADCNECRGLATSVAAPSGILARIDGIEVTASSTGEMAELLNCLQEPAPSAEQPTSDQPLVLTIPTIMGVYVRIEGERVFISQPGQAVQSLHLNRERGLALGKFLCEHLGT